jgi:hypothetical protein
MYIAMLAIQMYNQRDLLCNELFCEHHEDVLAHLNDGQFLGIQIKTQDAKYGKYKLSKTKDIIEKFIKLDLRFPKYFNNFILVTNCGFNADPQNNLDHLIKNIDDQNKLPQKMKTMVNEIQENCKCSSNDVVLTIKKIKNMIGPSDSVSLYSKILDPHISSIEECNTFSFAKVKEIRDTLIFRIEQASTDTFTLPIEDYFAFIEGNSSLNSIKINKKRITKEMISNIIRGNPVQVQLKSRTLNYDVNNNNMKALTMKMNKGGIDPLEIEVMKDLAFASDEFLLEKYHLSDNKIPREIVNLRQIIRNNAIEAYSETTKKQLFGHEMLKEIQKKLKNLIKNESETIDDTPYEVLKGIVANLTNECYIKFNM